MLCIPTLGTMSKTKLEEDDVLMEMKVFATMDHINVPPTMMKS
jgi:hypothetical protein